MGRWLLQRMLAAAHGRPSAPHPAGRLLENPLGQPLVSAGPSQRAWGKAHLAAEHRLPAPPLDLLQLTSHVLMVLPAAAIGLIAGLCAILFTTINLKARAAAAPPAWV